LFLDSLSFHKGQRCSRRKHASFYFEKNRQIEYENKTIFHPRPVLPLTGHGSPFKDTSPNSTNKEYAPDINRSRNSEILIS